MWLDSGLDYFEHNGCNGNVYHSYWFSSRNFKTQFLPTSLKKYIYISMYWLLQINTVNELLSFKINLRYLHFNCEKYWVDNYYCCKNLNLNSARERTSYLPILVSQLRVLFIPYLSRTIWVGVLLIFHTAPLSIAN